MPPPRWPGRTPAIAETHRGGLLALVRDIANPIGSDPRFPRFRHEVNNLTTFDDGNSQTNAFWWVATRP